MSEAVVTVTESEYAERTKKLKAQSKLVESMTRDELIAHGLEAHILGYYAEAIKVYELAAKQGELTVNHCSRIFDAASKIGDYPRAFHWGVRTLVDDPCNPTTLNNLGIACIHLNDRAQAKVWLERALAVVPLSFGVLNNIALIDRALGNYTSAVGRMLKAKNDQTSDNLIKNTANLLYYIPGVPPEVINGIHQEWYNRWGQRRTAIIRRKPLELDPDKKLRVALVSSDWRNHPVGRNFLPVFKGFDRTRMEFYTYHQHGLMDAVSNEYEAGSAKFTSTLAHGMQSVAQMIASDECNIAMYFAGHFDDNKVMVASYRPAPVQISYLDCGRFWLPELDYLIVGRKYAPRDLREMGTERILGVPNFYQHEPIPNAPDVAPPPFLERGFFTFGSYNSPVKLNDEVLATWRTILEACPASMLLFRYRAEFGHADVAKRVLNAMGPFRDRVIFDPATEKTKNHLEVMRHIDLHLDTFPFCGSTTTFELAWQGVPTLTMTGPTIMSNYGAGINDQLRLPAQFTTSAVHEYAAHAIGLYNNPEPLIKIRQTLRQACVDYICKPNSKYVARWLRALWRKHCKEAVKDAAEEQRVA